jgi:hypothetical protein
MSNTRRRTMKKVISDHVGDQVTAATEDTTPIITPARTAPPIDPRPPSTTTDSNLEIKS